MTLSDLRDDLACARDVRFLNYAATAPLLKSSAEVMSTVARESTRPMAEHFESWLGRVESTRRGLAETLGARHDEITFTTNTSTALSLIAGAVRWRTGDRVLFPADEFPSNRFVWDNLRDHGVETEAVPPEPRVSFAEQLAGRDLESVRLVAVSHVSYRDGRVHDVAAISALCRPRGILVAVDGIQAVGAIPVDVHTLGCDFLACGGQKWLLGPLGSAFLYIARDRLDELHVPTVGWASSRYAGDHDAPTFAWTEGAARFEGGLPDVAAIATMGASLERLRATGWTRVFARVAELRGMLVGELEARGMQLLWPESSAGGSGIVSFRPPESAAERIVAELERARVLVTPRHGAIRVSAHATTGDDEIRALLEVLDACLGRRSEKRPAHGEPPRAEPEVPAPRPSSARWEQAIVTGASRGLGAAFAEALAARGCALSLLGRDAAALELVAERLSRAHGIQVSVMPVDLADARGLEAWIAAHRPALETTDLLVNNAAWAEASPFLDQDSGVDRTAFETNVMGPMALARAVLPGMLARGRGNVLNVVTSGARNALPLFSSYAASKAALWAWSEALSRELDGTGVAVTSFVPPHMDTATRRQLGRRAIGFFAPDETSRGPGRKLDPPLRVAERGLAAAAAGRSTVTPARVRWETALNALAPERVRARVRRAWKGLGRRSR